MVVKDVPMFITPTDIPILPTATPCITCDKANLVWPSIHTLRPTSDIAGGRIEVEGNGRFYYLNGAYDESSRSFPLYFGGVEEGSISCYVNRCSGAFNVPVDTTPGRYQVNSEGCSFYFLPYWLPTFMIILVRTLFLLQPTRNLCNWDQ